MSKTSKKPEGVTVSWSRGVRVDGVRIARLERCWLNSSKIDVLCPKTNDRLGTYDSLSHVRKCARATYDNFLRWGMDPLRILSIWTDSERTAIEEACRADRAVGVPPTRLSAWPASARPSKKTS